MEAMAYLFAMMVLAALVARFGRQLLPGRAGLALQLMAASLAAGLAVRTAGVAMDQVQVRQQLFLVVVVGMMVSGALIFAIFARPKGNAGQE